LKSFIIKMLIHSDKKLWFILFFEKFFIDFINWISHRKNSWMQNSSWLKFTIMIYERIGLICALHECAYQIIKDLSRVSEVKSTITQEQNFIFSREIFQKQIRILSLFFFFFFNFFSKEKKNFFLKKKFF